LARGDSPALVARAAGHSLAISNKHYLSRSENLTKEAALAWFSIVPDDVGGEQEKPATRHEAEQFELLVKS